MANTEHCPKCGSAEKEWMERSLDGDSKCAACGYVGESSGWVTFVPSRTGAVGRQTKALDYAKKELAHLGHNLALEMIRRIENGEPVDVISLAK